MTAKGKLDNAFLEATLIDIQLDKPPSMPTVDRPQLPAGRSPNHFTVIQPVLSPAMRSRA